MAKNSLVSHDDAVKALDVFNATIDVTSRKARKRLGHLDRSTVAQITRYADNVMKSETGIGMRDIFG